MVETKIGNSGSPILAKNRDGEYEVVGIHTHKSSSPNYKSGLYFSDEILETLKQFIKDLSVEKSIEVIQTNDDDSFISSVISEMDGLNDC